MTFWDWLGTTQGTETLHALLVLLNIVTIAISARTHAKSAVVERRLNTYVTSLMRQIHGGHEHR